MLQTSLPFRLKDDMVWIRAHVHGHDLDGILDSDSDETFLDTQSADRLGLQKRTEHPGPVSPGIEKTASVTFDLGSSALVSPRLNILSIKNQFPDMDFILGFDALGKTPFTVDYTKEVIRLGTVPTGLRVPFARGRDVPSTEIKFSGITVNGVVDTGAPAGLDLPFTWVNSKLPSTQFLQTRERKDLGPRFEALPFIVDEAIIGRVTLSTVKAEAIRRKSDPLKDHGDNWATIGNLLLKRFEQVGIDGPHRNCVFVAR
jgi:hypothetical protein